MKEEIYKAFIKDQELEGMFEQFAKAYGKEPNNFRYKITLTLGDADGDKSLELVFTDEQRKRLLEAAKKDPTGMYTWDDYAGMGYIKYEDLIKLFSATEPITLDTHNFYSMEKTAMEEGDYSDDDWYYISELLCEVADGRAVGFDN